MYILPGVGSGRRRANTWCQLWVAVLAVCASLGSQGALFLASLMSSLPSLSSMSRTSSKTSLMATVFSCGVSDL